MKTFYVYGVQGAKLKVKSLQPTSFQKLWRIAEQLSGISWLKEEKQPPNSQRIKTSKN